MIPIKRILCPIDFFGASSKAANYAAALARHYHASLKLLHVVPPVLPTTLEYPVDIAGLLRAMQESAKKDLRRIAERVRSKGVSVECEVRVGNIDEEIRRVIERDKPDMIAMGAHGRRGFERWLMGSVTERLIRHSTTPILTISGRKGRRRSPERLGKILVTTDFSDGTADALAYAVSLASENKSEVSLLYVVHEDTSDVSGKFQDSLMNKIQRELDGLVLHVSSRNCRVSTRLETGIPYRTILNILDHEKIDLLIMNIHGKGILERAIFGSTAEHIVRSSSSPVLLIPPGRPVRAAKKDRTKKRAA